MRIIFLVFAELFIPSSMFAADDVLPPGKYMLSAPAIYQSRNKEVALELFCEIKNVNGMRRLLFIDRSGGQLS